MRRTTRSAWVLLAGLAIWGCSSDRSAPAPTGQAASKGQLDLYLTDAPLRADVVREVLVRIDTIEARQGAAWVIVDATPKTLDLIPLRDGKKALLCSANLATGDWVEVRLTLGPAKVTLRDGRTFAVPAPGQVRVPLQGVLVGDTPKELTLDFDLEKSFDLKGDTISLTPHVVVYEPQPAKTAEASPPTSGAATASSPAVAPSTPPAALPPAETGLSLFRALGPERCEGKRPRTISVSPPTTEGTWFLTIDRDPGAVATVRVDGRLVLRPSDFFHRRRLLRVPIQVSAQTKVRVHLLGRRPKGIDLTLDGVVPESEVPANEVRRVVFVSPLFEESFRRGTHHRDVPLDDAGGLFTLRTTSQGFLPWIRVTWNQERLFQPWELLGHARGRSRDAPVDVESNNELDLRVSGLRYPKAHVTLEGWVVDTTPPALQVVSPTDGACVNATAEVRLDLGDALPSTLFVELNGVPTTEAFVLSGSTATATLSALSGLQEGSNTLRVLAQDAARNLGETIVTFEADTTGPTLSLAPATGTEVVAVSTVSPTPPANRIEVAPFAPTEAAATHSNASGDHAFWLPDLPGGPTYVFVGEPNFYEYSTGQAYLSATIASATDPTKRWIASILFESTTAQPKLELRPEHYVQNGGPIDPSTWRYYRFVPGQATLIGDGSFAGKRLDLFMRPANGTHTFQLGPGANGKNLNLGLSGWLGHTGDYSATRGDINVDLAPATRTELPIPLCATYQDTGCGLSLPALGFEATLDGIAITDSFTVAIDAAKAVSPPLAAGTHRFEACVSDVVGNKSTVSSTFEVVFTATLEGIVAGGPNQNAIRVVSNAKVEVDIDGTRHSATSDAEGRFELTGLPTGKQLVVVVDGLTQGLGRTSLVVPPLSAGVTAADRIWVLPQVDFSTGAALSLDSQGRTTTQHQLTLPGVPGLSVTIPAGAEIRLPPGVTFPPGVPPTLVLGRLANGAIPNPLPGAKYAPVLYSLQPEGTVVVGGYSLTLPNDQFFTAGQSVEFFAFNPAVGSFVQRPNLTVSNDAATLSGSGADTFGLLAATTDGILATVEGQVDIRNAQLSRMLAQTGGRPILNVGQPTAGILPFSVLVPIHPTRAVGVDILYTPVNQPDPQSRRAGCNAIPPHLRNNAAYNLYCPGTPTNPNPPPPPPGPTGQTFVGAGFITLTLGGGSAIPEVVGPAPPGTFSLVIGTTGDGNRVQRVFARTGTASVELGVQGLANQVFVSSPAVLGSGLSDGLYDLELN